MTHEQIDNRLGLIRGVETSPSLRWSCVADVLAHLVFAPSALPPAPAAAEKTKTRGEEIAEQMVKQECDSNKVQVIGSGETVVVIDRFPENPVSQYLRGIIARAIDAADTAAEQRGKAETKAAAVALVKRWREDSMHVDELVRQIESL